MPEPFIAEIKMFGFNFAPRDWAFCNGQILPINQNQSLFSLVGTTYGGDGRTTFALPDLRGRTPMHVGTGLVLGQKSGQETHTLVAAETPTHTHRVVASTEADATPSPVPLNGYFGSSPEGANAYAAANNLGPMAANTVLNAGNNQAHDNMSPYLAVTFCIALRGLFPSRN